MIPGRNWIRGDRQAEAHTACRQTKTNEKIGIPTSEEAKDAENTSGKGPFRHFWSFYKNQHEKSCGIDLSLQKVDFWPKMTNLAFPPVKRPKTLKTYPKKTFF